MPKEECWTIRNSHEDKEAQYPILVVYQAVVNYSFPSFIHVIKLLTVAALCWWCFGELK